MNQIDERRIAAIAQRFLIGNGTTAITSWTPTDFDNLQVNLHNTIMREYPELDSDIRFRITMAVRVHANDPLEVHVEILRVMGEVKIQV